MSPAEDKYSFTPAEAAHFAARVQEVRSAEALLRSGLLLVIAQQALTGNWRMAEDGSGLVRDGAPPALIPAAPPLPEGAPN